MFNILTTTKEGGKKLLEMVVIYIYSTIYGDSFTDVYLPSNTGRCRH